jgi:Domain of unknown function DUF11
VTNNGPSDAPDVLFSDTLPEGTRFLSGMAPPEGVCSVTVEDDLTVVGCQGPVLPVGATVTGTLTIATSPDLTGELANTAYIGSGALDQQLRAAGSQNESTAVAPVVTLPSPGPVPDPSPGPAPDPSPGSPGRGSGGMATTGIAVGGLVLVGLALLGAGALARRRSRASLRAR